MARTSPSAAGQTTTTTDSSGNVTIGTGAGSTATVQTVLSAIDGITGATTASTVNGSGQLILSTGTAQNLVIAGGTATRSRRSAWPRERRTSFLPRSPARRSRSPPPATARQPTSPSAPAPARFRPSTSSIPRWRPITCRPASITTGAITITTTNNAASSTIGAFTGSTATQFSSLSAAAPVADPNSQSIRASLVAQYNQVLQNINTTAQDSSFNGINLLNGDTLNLTFDETGASKLAIAGVTFNDAGLGLSSLTTGTDFVDSNSANAVLAQLTQASTTLRTAASSLGSNLSIVEIRQDFNKNLINVLQTGASNLTVADPNQEAANSQALSTRQSIAVSALALANQSQQSVLQLLR